MQNIITLGYDPAKGKFVGTFIASMMTHLWLMRVRSTRPAKSSTLDAEGPRHHG